MEHCQAVAHWRQNTVCSAGPQSVSLGGLLWSQFPVYLGPVGILPGVGNWGPQGRTPLCSFTCHVGREWQSLAVGAGPSLVPSLCQAYESMEEKKEDLLQEIQALLFTMKAFPLWQSLMKETVLAYSICFDGKCECIHHSQGEPGIKYFFVGRNTQEWKLSG